MYVYEMMIDHISQTYAKYNSIEEARRSERRAKGTVSKYLDTNVPLRGKLCSSTPIVDFKETFKLAKAVSKGMRHDLNIAQTVWAYDAHTLELTKGSPFASKTQASTGTDVHRNVITNVLDTGKPEGIKGIYFYSRQLTGKEIKGLLAKVDTVQTYRKKVLAYNPLTLDLIQTFTSLKRALLAKHAATL